VPTLIMNGALDHVIPKDALDDLASGLRNAHVFVFEGVAHAPVDVGDCALTMMMAFLADPSTAPDATCMADYRHTFALPE
jgi:pimeloyl-ACP methyl ester carboxylesterase